MAHNRTAEQMAYTEQERAYTRTTKQMAYTGEEKHASWRAERMAQNENKNGEDANMEGFMHSRYTISVAGVGRNGLHASYSTPGAPNLISAPGGDVESIHNNVVALATGGCYDATL